MSARYGPGVVNTLLYVRLEDSGDYQSGDETIREGVVKLSISFGVEIVDQVLISRGGDLLGFPAENRFAGSGSFVKAADAS